MTFPSAEAPGWTSPDASSLILFPLDGADAIAPLIGTLRARGESLIARWRELAAARLGPHRTLSEQLFRETYIPGLRAAVESLGRGDRTSFVALAGDFGAQIARAGLPFAVVMAHVNLLKESCLAVLTGDEVE